MDMVKSSTGFNEENGVQAKAELKDTEFTEVRDHITSSLGKPVQKKRPAQKEPESAEKKRRREASTSRTTCIRKCKALV